MPPPPPPPNPYAAQQQQQHQPYPALYLYPLNDSFVPKHISLVGGQRVKIGRQTNPKTAPGEKNGFFDSKVLSRQHAEIWEEGGKIYIKDVKSSNGTFINGERLSPEGVESEPYELKSDDIVEFGIDIVGEDNKTIIHHKVAARAVCVFCEQDAQVAARAEQHQQQQQQQQQHQQHLLQQQQQQQQQYAQHSLIGSSQNPIPSQFNFVPGPQQRRPGPNVPPQGLAGIGGMGGAMRPPGKSGLTFEHIFSRLQGELQKSRETGSELHSLSGSITDIHDVLGGNLPSNIPPYPASLPPARPTRQPSPSQPQQDSHPVSSSPPPDQQQQPSSPSNPSTSSPILITQLQSQLRDTQSSLAEHANKVRALEDIFADHQVIRKEVHDLRQLIENPQREIMFDGVTHDTGVHPHHLNHHHLHHGSPHHHQQDDEEEDGLLEPRGGFDHDDDDDIQHIRMLDEVDDDDDDVRSLATIIPHQLERVDEEDEDEAVATTSADSEQVLDEDGYGEDRADPIDPEREREQQDEDSGERERHFEQAAEHEQEALRKQEDLNVGRPRTPEPSFGLRESSSSSPSSKDSTTTGININTTASPRTRSGTLLAPSSPLSLSSPNKPQTNGISGSSHEENDMLSHQILQLSAQISAMVKITSNMEAQYASAQDTIKSLEDKVRDLEKVVKEGEKEKEKEKELEEKEMVEEKPEEDAADKPNSLTNLFTEFKSQIADQWSSIKSEWTSERQLIQNLRSEWESKLKHVDVGLEKVNQLQNTGNSAIMGLVKDVSAQKTEMGKVQRELRDVMGAVRANAALGFANGDVVKMGSGGSGLVTPPSPRSQSSDSEGRGGGSGGEGGAKRRRKRRSISEGRGRAMLNARRVLINGVNGADEEGEESDDATLAEEGPSSLGLDVVKVTAFAGDSTTATTTTTTTIASKKSLRTTRDKDDDEHDDGTTHDAGSNSSMFASEEEVEEGRKVPGPRVRVKTMSTLAKDGITRTSRSASTEEDVSDLPSGQQGMVTPESMTASSSVIIPGGPMSSSSDKSHTSTSTTKSNAGVNFQTAGAVVVLAVAAAAVFYKVRSE